MKTIETNAEYDEEGSVVKVAHSEESGALGLQAILLATVALAAC